MKYHFILVHRSQTSAFVGSIPDKIGLTLAQQEADVEFEIPIAPGITYVFYTTHVYPAEWYPHFAQKGSELKERTYAEVVQT